MPDDPLPDDPAANGRAGPAPTGSAPDRSTSAGGAPPSVGSAASVLVSVAVAPATGTDAGCNSSSLGAGFRVPSSTIIRTGRWLPVPAARSPVRNGNGEWVISPP